MPLQLNFERTGRPIIFFVHNGLTFEANFILATTKPDNETQTEPMQSKRLQERNKRKESTIQGSVNKKAHLEVDDLKCLDEDSHLFNFVDMPDVNIVSVNGSSNNCLQNANDKIDDNMMDCDNIPASPTSKNLLRTVFRRCFESTFDPKNLQNIILAENSDSE